MAHEVGVEVGLGFGVGLVMDLGSRFCSCLTFGRHAELDVKQEYWVPLQSCCG